MNFAIRSLCIMKVSEPLFSPLSLPLLKLNYTSSSVKNFRIHYEAIKRTSLVLFQITRVTSQKSEITALRYHTTRKSKNQSFNINKFCRKRTIQSNRLKHEHKQSGKNSERQVGECSASTIGQSWNGSGRLRCAGGVQGRFTVEGSTSSRGCITIYDWTFEGWFNLRWLSIGGGFADRSEISFHGFLRSNDRCVSRWNALDSCLLNNSSHYGLSTIWALSNVGCSLRAHRS